MRLSSPPSCAVWVLECFARPCIAEPLSPSSCSKKFLNLVLFGNSTSIYRYKIIKLVIVIIYLLCYRIEAVQMVFVVGGACMGALGLMLLCLGCLATGATRHKVYRAWRARVGGRISCAVVSRLTLLSFKIQGLTFNMSYGFQFMGITYVLSLLWLVLLCFLVIVTFVFTIFWMMCSNPDVQESKTCIDFNQFCMYTLM